MPDDHADAAIIRLALPLLTNKVFKGTLFQQCIVALLLIHTPPSLRAF